MATKLDLLKLFSTGQGGGISSYTSYPADHDTNYSSIETTVNQVIDELAAAALSDSLIPRDLIDRRDVDTTLLGARYTQDGVRITFAGAIITYTSGFLLIKNQRVEISGGTVDVSSLSLTTYHIPIDQSGNVLTPSTVPDTQFYDIATFTVVLGPVVGVLTDNSFNGGRTLVATDQGFLQQVYTPTGGISDPTDVDFPHRLNPPMRYADAAGVVGESGFFADAERWHWVAPEATRATGTALIGDTVVGAILNEFAQQELKEQARVMLIRDTTDLIANTGSIPVEWDTLPTANVAGDPERFEPESHLDPIDWQGGTGNRDIEIPNNAAYTGTYSFTLEIDMVTSDETFIDVSIVRTIGGAVTIARTRVAPAPTNTVINLAGMYDLAANNDLQVQITHDASGDMTLTSARFTAMLVGGSV